MDVVGERAGRDTAKAREAPFATLVDSCDREHCVGAGRAVDALLQVRGELGILDTGDPGKGNWVGDSIARGTVLLDASVLGFSFCSSDVSFFRGEEEAGGELTTRGVLLLAATAVEAEELDSGLVGEDRSSGGSPVRAVGVLDESDG